MGHLVAVVMQMERALCPGGHGSSNIMMLPPVAWPNGLSATDRPGDFFGPCLVPAIQRHIVAGRGVSGLLAQVETATEPQQMHPISPASLAATVYSPRSPPNRARGANADGTMALRGVPLCPVSNTARAAISTTVLRTRIGQRDDEN
jgi:hypothetical protein